MLVTWVLDGSALVCDFLAQIQALGAEKMMKKRMMKYESLSMSMTSILQTKMLWIAFPSESKIEKQLLRLEREVNSADFALWIAYEV